MVLMIVREKTFLPDALVRLRDKYPVIRSKPDAWDKVRKLVAQGDEVKAEELIKQVIAASPRLLIRNKVAIRHRILRREFLVYQKEVEGKIQSELTALSDRIEKMLVNNAGDDGTIGFAKMRGLIKRLKTYNTEAWTAIRVIIQQAVRQSIHLSIDFTMKSAQQGIDDATKEAEYNFHLAYYKFGLVLVNEQALSEVKATLAKTDVVYQTIFTRVQKNRMKKGLFRGEEGSGLTLSQQVWDLRDGHLTKMRRIIAGGIGNGRPASAISRDIKGMTIVGQMSKDELANTRTGPGVYRSAYKNALRVVRSETNQAYQEAQAEYAKEKGFKQMWNVSTGKRSEDECDDLNGQIFDPEDVPALPHPNCSCYLTTVLPEVG